MKKIFACVLLTILLTACAPQAVTVNLTPTKVEPTATAIPATSTLIPTALPTDTPLPTSTASPVPPACAMPLNPTENASVPAKGPFDFTWTAFEGAVSYVVSIGPTDWYPTNFPVTGTVLTRYMEIFPSSPSYQWSITALDGSGKEICKTGPYTFVTSVDQSATPSFADSGIVQPTVASQSNSQGSNPPLNTAAQDFTINLLSVEDGACSLTTTFSVPSTYPINFSVLRYTLDPNEANSGDFCNWGSGINLWAGAPGIYQGSFDLSNYPSLHNGDTIYLMAKFIYNQGVVACSQLIQHTLTCAGN